MCFTSEVEEGAAAWSVVSEEPERSQGSRGEDSDREAPKRWTASTNRKKFREGLRADGVGYVAVTVTQLLDDDLGAEDITPYSC